MPKNKFQIENGFNYRSDNEGLGVDIVDLQSLWRYGLLDNFEIRMTLGYRSLKQKTGNAQSFTGIVPVTIGSKIAITEENGLIPEVAFIGQLSLPYVGEELFTPEDVEPSFRFSFTHTLSEKLTLGYNLGMEWVRAEESGIYSVVLGIGVTEKLGLFVEQFGQLLGDFDLETGVDAGLTYLLSNNFQLDLSGGLGVSRNADDLFVGAGFSWRLPQK